MCVQVLPVGNFFRLQCRIQRMANLFIIKEYTNILYLYFLGQQSILTYRLLSDQKIAATVCNLRTNTF